MATSTINAHVLCVDATLAKRSPECMAAVWRACFLKAQLCFRAEGDTHKNTRIAVVVFGSSQTANPLRDAFLESSAELASYDDYNAIVVARHLQEPNDALLSWLLDKQNQEELVSTANANANANATSSAQRADWLEALAVACYVARTELPEETKTRKAHITVFSPLTCALDDEAREGGDAEYVRNFVDENVVQNVELVAVDPHYQGWKRTTPHAGIRRARALAESLNGLTSAKFVMRHACNVSEVCAVRLNKLKTKPMQTHKSKIHKLCIGGGRWMAVDMAMYYKAEEEAVPRGGDPDIKRDTQYVKLQLPTSPAREPSAMTATPLSPGLVPVTANMPPKSPFQKMREEWKDQDDDFLAKYYRPKPGDAEALAAAEAASPYASDPASSSRVMTVDKTMKMQTYGRDSLPVRDEEFERLNQERLEAMRKSKHADDLPGGSMLVTSFVPRNCVPRHLWMSSAEVVCASNPQKASSKHLTPSTSSRLVVGALCRSMLEQDVVAIVRLDDGTGTKVELGVLVPYPADASLPPGAATNRTPHDALLYSRLPFKDDVKMHHAIADEPREQPSEAQLNAARRSVRLLDLDDELAPETTPNPIMQNFHVALHRAHAARAEVEGNNVAELDGEDLAAFAAPAPTVPSAEGLLAAAKAAVQHDPIDDIVLREALLDLPVPASKRRRTELAESLRSLGEAQKCNNLKFEI
ncbi:hypothetical protein PPROV_000647200 [Pycnococcus provasolii]|uniref:Ku domain-containing protein n=1 Tax=Pycnococcus provasolii TaxID=41880 RepID=A0A830HPL3_9CHLO|nr:hypothetical protein PPROV_000647200 [Pycnococcus provasolii]